MFFIIHLLAAIMMSMRPVLYLIAFDKYKINAVYWDGYFYFIFFCVFFFSLSEVPALNTRLTTNPPEEESVSFHKLSYLGHMKVSAPRSETEALRAMSSMRAHCSAPITVTLYVPNVAEGSVRWVQSSELLSRLDKILQQDRDSCVGVFLWMYII